MPDLVLCDEHTIDRSLLTGGWVIDVGCRNWRFTDAVIGLGEKVIGIDPNPDVQEHPWAIFRRAALEHGIPGGQVCLRVCDNGNGTHTVDPGTEGDDIITAPVISLPELMEMVPGTLDVFKIDAEGAEFGILANWPGPVARQLTVEFHHFWHRSPPDPDAAIAEIAAHLGQWYTPVKHEKTLQWGRWAYWDSLWVLKPEFR